MGNKSMIREMGSFLWQRKAWWLLPVVAMIALVGGLILFGQSSAVSPFIYALF